MQKCILRLTLKEPKGSILLP